MPQETYRCNLTPHKTIHSQRRASQKDMHNNSNDCLTEAFVYSWCDKPPMKSQETQRCSVQWHAALAQNPWRTSLPTWRQHLSARVAGDGSRVRIREKMYPKSTLHFPERNVVLYRKDTKPETYFLGTDIEQEFGGVGWQGTPVKVPKTDELGSVSRALARPFSISSSLTHTW